MNTATPIAPSSIPNSYLKLIRRRPLRPIRSEHDYDAALELLDELMVRDERTIDAGEKDYLEVLSELVESYDREHFSGPLPHAAPLDILKHLMDQRDMNAADLGRLLGSSGLASDLLHGKRELSKNHIRKLADYFKVEAGVFV